MFTQIGNIHGIQSLKWCIYMGYIGQQDACVYMMYLIIYFHDVFRMYLGCKCMPYISHHQYYQSSSEMYQGIIGFWSIPPIYRTSSTEFQPIKKQHKMFGNVLLTIKDEIYISIKFLSTFKNKYDDNSSINIFVFLHDSIYHNQHKFVPR